jgi:hypothetical protein
MLRRLLPVVVLLILLPVHLAASGGAVIWKAGSSALGKWEKATDDQCGLPAASGAAFTFALTQDTAKFSCARNMANLLDPSGDDLLGLDDGHRYTFSFRFVDLGMADADARSLIWQIHGHPEPHTPCTSLNLYNEDGVGSAQRWALGTCDAAGVSQMGENKPVWTGAFTPGESDEWKIVVVPSNTARGSVALYRNGHFEGSWKNIVTYHGENPPWVGIGIYKWIWLSRNESTASSVRMRIEDLTIATP